LDWSQIPNQDIETASPSTILGYAQVNAQAIEAIKANLMLPWRVPLAGAYADIDPAVHDWRAAARAIAVMGRAAENDTAPQDAMMNYYG